MFSQAQAGPSVTRPSPSARHGEKNGADGPNVGDGGDGDLWSDILGSARRQKAFGRKNVLVLSERHHGRSYLISKLKGEDKVTHAHTQHRRRRLDTLAPSGTKTGAGATAIKNASTDRAEGPRTALALGYDVMHIRDDGDEESVPPVSIYYPPSSGNGLLGAVPAALPPTSISDTVVMIVLDWSRPARMLHELLRWLRWIDGWTSTLGGEEMDSGVNGMTMREKLQLHLQRYSEPPAPSSTSTRSALPSDGTTASTLPASSSVYAYNSSGPLLPLGQGTMTLNAHGVPIVVVCTKADQMDAAGGTTAGIKGNAWEERCDWVQQVLRTVCLAYGAALFYTATNQPQTYTHLRQYLLHRLYTIPIPPHSDDLAASLPAADSHPPAQDQNHAAALTNSRFPFSLRANVLDKEAVMVPAGWDSWGKIKVLREGYEPHEMLDGLEESLKHSTREEMGEEEQGRGLEGVWRGMIPELEHTKTTTSNTLTTHVEPEQSFLSRHFDTLAKDPNRDPRAAFRNPTAASSSNTATLTSTAAASASTAGNGSTYAGVNGESDKGAAGYGGVVGPLGAGGLALPGVERAMAEMEGQGAEDLKEKFARLGRKDPKTPGAVTSPVAAGSEGKEGKEGKSVPNEALHNFFQGLLATKSKSKSSAPPTPAPIPANKESESPPASASTEGTA